MGEITNFPDGISSFGSPVTGSIPTGGSVYFLDTVNGSDANDGKSPAGAKKSLAAAYALTVANKNDIVYWLAGATANVLTSAFTWAKNYTHLIGVCSPVSLANRCRITQAAAGVIPTLFTVSAHGCIIKNIQVFQGSSSALALVAANVTGQRNYFEGCHFAGGGHATPAGEVGATSLQIVGGSENRFQNCTIGLDTITRSAASAVLDLQSAATRNQFIDCVFPTMTSAAGHVFVRADTAADIDRFVIFKRCEFLNAVGSTSTTMTNWGEIHTSAGGVVVLDNCIVVGCTDINSTDAGNVYTNGAQAAATGSIGIAVTR